MTSSISATDAQATKINTKANATKMVFNTAAGAMISSNNSECANKRCCLNVARRRSKPDIKPSQRLPSQENRAIVAIHHKQKVNQQVGSGLQEPRRQLR